MKTTNTISKRRVQNQTLFTFMSYLIVLLRANGQHRTMQHYQATLNSFLRFLCHLQGEDVSGLNNEYLAKNDSSSKEFSEKKDISSGKLDVSFSELDAELIQSYEAYLKNVAKVCRNTSSFYMRILRAVYNKAVEQGLVVFRQNQHSGKWDSVGFLSYPNPFKDVYTGIAKTNKRAIPTDSVSQIKHLESVKDITAKEEVARDAFLMSFYLHGISFIDLAHLRKSDIKDGILHYTRSKTGQRLSVRLEKEMREIIDKYQKQTASSSYLFPFLVDGSNGKDKPAEMGGKESDEVQGKGRNEFQDRIQDEYRLYHNAEARISYHLKKLGKKMGLKGNLTLYVARHSWATTARDQQVPISVISMALGHTSETTTQIYLRSIQSSEVDEANAKILAALL